MPFFSQSSEGRRELEREMRRQNRLPPGQSLTIKWPVLHAGAVPHFDPKTWDFRVWGLVENPVRLSYQQMLALPQTEVTADMHCVTHWSMFDNRWRGIAARAIIERAGPKSEAKYVLVHAEQGFTANVPLADLLSGDVLFAHQRNGEDITAEHGYPLRLVVPKLYAWKSVKWVRGMELLAADRPGFWEAAGYHMYGDPFREQRFR